MYPARRRARRTASALLEVAMQSAFQEKCSYTMAVRGLLDVGSVTVRRMRAFALANEMGRVGVSVMVAAAFANSSAASLPGMTLVTWNPDESGGAFPVVWSLVNRLGVMCSALNSFK